MQSEIECVINNTAYPNFLLSEIYLQHVQLMQSAAVATASASSSSSTCSAQGNLPRSLTLPTLHEDTELSICEEAAGMHVMGSHTPSDVPLRLTRNLLLATQNRRLEVRPPGLVQTIWQLSTFIAHLAATSVPIGFLIEFTVVQLNVTFCLSFLLIIVAFFYIFFLYFRCFFFFTVNIVRWLRLFVDFSTWITLLSTNIVLNFEIRRYPLKPLFL